MAINFTDFSKMPLQEAPFANLFENVLKGYKMGKEPARMEAERQAKEEALKKSKLETGLKELELGNKPKDIELTNKQKELANALQEKANAHYEEKLALDRQVKEAQIKKYLQTSVGGNAKANGKYANWLVAHENATPEERREAYDKISALEEAHERAITNRSEDITSGNSFDKLPVNEKKRAVGLTTAMGIDPVQAVKELRSGKSLEEIAKEKGKKLEDLTPMYPLDGENVKQLQKRVGVVNELKNMEGKITAPLAKYQNQIAGYSIEQVADALSGKNPDEQGKVLAARALGPEIASLRLKAAGGNIGIEAINELQNKSLGNLKIVRSSVSPEAYTSMQKYINEWLGEASDVYNKTMEDYGRLKSPEQKSTGNESSGFNFAAYPVAGG